MKIRHIIFDVGNVLFGYDPTYILHQILPNNKFHQEYLDCFFNAQEWQDLDRGVLPFDDLLQILSQKILDPNLNRNVQLIIDNFVYHLNLIKGTKDIFLNLREKYFMYLLSNFQAVPFSKLREMHPFLLQVNGQVISAHHQLMKPETEIYHQLFSTYNLIPNESIFIDDLEPNIEEAKALGCHGIIFKSPEQLKDALLQYGVTI